ncbi:MAG: nucleoside-diphosphate kinase [bacterium]|nr:nucleoside-diphosphate kinase [bacterium]
MEQTVVLIKPDGVKRALTGEIIGRFERISLKIVSMKMVWVTQTVVGKHYQDDINYHRKVGERTLANYKEFGIDPNEKLGTNDPVEIGRLVRKWNMEFLSSGPVIAMLLEGPEAVRMVRKIVGATYPSESNPGTIRGDYSVESPMVANTQGRTIRNLIHASGNVEEANFERKLWFHEKEIYPYKRVGEE